MKRRLLPILMNLVLVCALPIWAAFVTSGDVTNPLVCTAWADTAEGERNSGTTQETFTEVTDETTLKKAVEDGKSVRMTQDITLTSPLCIEKTVTLDLNGHVLTRKNTDRYDIVIIQSGATLTLIDSNTGNLQHRFNAGETGWTKAADNATGDGIVTVTGGVIYGDAGSSIINPCGIKILKGKLEMYGGSIVGIRNVYNANGGGVYVSDQCTFNMYGGSIKGCYVFSDGGGVYVAAGGTFTMSGSSAITNCKGSKGGAVYNAGTFTMRDNSHIADCIYISSIASGGGVHNKGTFTVEGGSITGSVNDYNREQSSDDICNENKLDVSEGITISCNVNVGYGGTISKGTFTGRVWIYWEGTILGGTFTNEVINYEGTIKAGEFTGKIENSYGKIDGGTFRGSVTSSGYNAIISDGNFHGTVTNESGATISGGTFDENVTNKTYAILNGGIFYGGVTNDGGTINDSAYVTVKFNSDNGAQAKEEKVLRGQKVAKPTDDPTKSGYTFTGWEDANGAGAYDFNTPVTAPLTLTAKWEKNPSSGGYYYYPTTDTKTTDTKGSPKTADPGVALYAALSILSLTGMVALNGKKR